MKQPFFFFLTLVVFMQACKKDTPIATTTTGSTIANVKWQLDSNFLYSSKVLYNSFADSNQLCLNGKDILGIVGKGDKLIEAALNLFSSGLTHFPMCSAYFMGIGGSSSSLFFAPTNQSLLDDVAQFYIDMKRLDSKFQYFNNFGYYNFQPINDAYQCLIPIVTKTDSVNYNAVFYLLNMQKKPYIGVGYYGLDTLSTKRIDFATEHLYNTLLYAIQSFYGKFFISIDSKGYVIYKDGTFKKTINETIYNYFAQNGVIYANGGAKTYRSDDKGETWTVQYNKDMVIGDIVNVNGDLYTYDHDRIQQISMTTGTPTIKDIPTTGMGGNQITSISYFDNKVYVSTLSGLFYKDYTHFKSDK